eukprot:9242902-Heterocapsa_arctica.AAC.1
MLHAPLRDLCQSTPHHQYALLSRLRHRLPPSSEEPFPHVSLMSAKERSVMYTQRAWSNLTAGCSGMSWSPLSEGTPRPTPGRRSPGRRPPR